MPLSLPRGEWYIYCLCLVPYLGAFTYVVVEFEVGPALLFWPLISVLGSIVVDVLKEPAPAPRPPREGFWGHRFDA